ncbi:tail fiber domain-containing protein [Hyphomicrobium sp. DY-1]|uniref:tail fiber domain-containing protein n=1 Tax=Hyphomicrobium sp. DY-1 TaxID=3075650 RepID=UPI0039C2F522
MRRALGLLLPLMGLLAMCQAANAACSNPVGNAGDMTYSTSANVMAYCDSTNWISMAGGVSFTVNTSGGGATPYGSTGDVQINSGGALGGDTGNFTYNASTLSAPIISASTANINTVNSAVINNTGLGTFGSILGNGGLTVLGAASMTTISATGISGTLIQVGTGGGASCSAGLNGALKYDTTSNTIAICVGTTWTGLNSGTITGAGVSGGSATAIAFWNGANSLTYESGTTSGLYWDHTNGWLGVGTNSPAKELTVSGSALLVPFSSTSSPTMFIKGDATYAGVQNVLRFRQSGSSAGGVAFSFFDYDPAIFMKPGVGTSTNIGVQTSSPTATLQVSGSMVVSTTGQNTLASASLAVDTRGVSISSVLHMGGYAISPIGAGGNVILSGTTAVSTSSAGSVTFYTGGAQRAVIDSSGNVGINTGTANGKLHIMQPSQASLGLVIGNAAYSTTPYNAMGMQVNDGGTAIIRGGWNTAKAIILNDNGGGVGIGGASVADTLDLNGGVIRGALRSRTGTGTAGSNAFNFYWTGGVAQLWVDSSNVGNITVSSDRRVKKDIKSLQEDSGLAVIEKMTPVSFHWKDPKSGTELQYGFIAQDMKKVLPDIVRNTGLKTKDTPDGLLRIEYNGLIAPIVKAVQDLKHLFDDDHGELKKLQAANENLEHRVDELQRELEKLKAAR